MRVEREKESHVFRAKSSRHPRHRPLESSLSLPFDVMYASTKTARKHREWHLHIHSQSLQKRYFRLQPSPPLVYFTASERERQSSINLTHTQAFQAIFPDKAAHSYERHASPADSLERPSREAGERKGGRPSEAPSSLLHLS